jgi:hypothetical protein
MTVTANNFGADDRLTRYSQQRPVERSIELLVNRGPEKIVTTVAVVRACIGPWSRPRTAGPQWWARGRLGAPDLQEFAVRQKSPSVPLPSHQASVRRVRACLAATLKPEQHRQTQETGVGDRGHRTAEAAICRR